MGTTPTDIKEINVVQISTPEKFTLQNGDWFGFYSPKTSNSHIFVNRGLTLRLQVTNPASRGNWVTVWAEVDGKNMKKGDAYAYELSSIVFPVDVEVKSARELIRALDYVENPTSISVLKGQRVEGVGLLDFTPTDHLVEILVTKPKEQTHFTLPFRLCLCVSVVNFKVSLEYYTSVAVKCQVKNHNFHNHPMRPLHSLLIYTCATKHSFAEKSAILTESLSNNALKGSFRIWYSGIFLVSGKIASIGAFCVSALLVKIYTK